MNRHIILHIIFLFSVALNAIGQNDSSSVENVTTDSTQKINVVRSESEAKPSDGAEYYFLSSKEFWLAITVIITLLIIIILELWLIRNRNISDESAIRLIVITLVIMGSLFLIMAGYTDRIVAPAFGLFGTIAGYMFSRNSGTNNDKS